MEVSRITVGRLYSWLMKFPHRVPPRPAQWTAVGAVALALIFIFPATAPAFLRWTNGSFQPKAFTAMWAVNPNRAMVGYSTGMRAVVAVQNETRHPHLYHWRAWCSSRTIRSGALDIPNNATRYITLRTNSCPGNKLTVSLANTGVWVTVKYITVFTTSTTTTSTTIPLFTPITTPTTTVPSDTTTTTVPSGTTSTSSTTTSTTTVPV